MKHLKRFAVGALVMPILAMAGFGVAHGMHVVASRFKSAAEAVMGVIAFGIFLVAVYAIGSAIIPDEPARPNNEFDVEEKGKATR